MFTFGNVITLALCVALILVFRQIDANNKSIDKVKKFTDKLKTDLDVYFKGRNDALKEAAVDLDVKQTHAIASVKRLEDFEANFVTRSKEMEQRINGLSEVEKRIQGYDTIIKDLIQMTSRAEENLQQLSNQSKHFDSAFRKINDMQSKIQQIDSSIPSLTEKFTQKNGEQLENIGKNMLDEFTTRTDALNDQYSIYLQKCESLYAQIDKHIADSFESAAKRAEALEGALFTQLQENSDKRSQEYISSIDTKNAAIRQRVDLQISEIQELARNFKTKVSEDMATYQDNVRCDMQNISAKFQDSLSLLDSKFSDFERETERRMEEFTQQLDSNDQRIAMTFEETEQKINVFKDDIKQNIKEAAAKLEDMNGEFAAKTTGMNEEFAAKTAELQNKFKDVETALKSTADQKIYEIEKSLHGQISGLEQQMVSSYDKISGDLEMKNTELLSEISTRFDTYKADVMYRFKTFEKFSSDVNLLDAQLRKSMDDIQTNVIKDFDEFMKGQQNKQKEFEKYVEDETINISHNVQNLERELNALKAQASDNMTEKLKLFEDDFFSDLNRKNDAITIAINNWTDTLDNRLAAIASETENERRNVEHQYAEELRAHLAELAEKYKDQSASYDEKLKLIESTLQEKLTNYEDNIHHFVDDANKALDQAKETTNDRIRTELETHAAEIDEKLNRQEREIAAHIKEVFTDVESTREKTALSLESVKSDFETWRDRLMQQFSESKDSFEERLESLKINSTELITQVGSSFSIDVENYAAKVKEEKDRLVNELDDLRSQMTQSVNNYEIRSSEILDEIKKQYGVMLDETSQKIREQNNDSEQKLRALKGLVQEITDKTEAQKEKLMLKMQSDANAINLSMDDIDKRLKGFIAQTQLFEKADELKIHLETEMGELRTEISRIESFRHVATDLEQQFIKIRRMEEEINQKFSKFIAEKKRIEIIENDFNTLMNLSSTIEQKITDLKNSNDDLQTLQLDIRRYQEGLADIGNRYDRLEKKNEVLEQTMTGIDRSFENLQQIEKRIMTCNLEVQKIPDQVDDIKKTVSELMNGTTRVNEAVDKLSSLDVVMNDTEKRMTEIQKVREWLARTETRMNELQKQADDQVRLMSDMLKNEPVPSSRGDTGRSVLDEGAPSSNLRETVERLSKNGWTIEEISNRVHRSRGEIELILEMKSGGLK